jgi:predicted RecB family nuclease
MPPQGAYLAKTCPEAVQLDILYPCEPLPRSPFMAMLGREGRDFEAKVFEMLVVAVPDAVVIDGDLSRSAREASTLGALERGVPLVIGGRLPVDESVHRAGEPDLLVRSDVIDPSATTLGYLPVDVKHHGTLQTKKNADAEGAVTSNLETLFLGPSGPELEMEPQWRWPDLIQLAHYQRMLEASGHAYGLGRWAGVAGREELVVWHDLDAPRWGLTEYIDDPPPQPLSTMEAYDLEFAHRIAVVDASLVHLSDPESPLLAEPIAVPECDGCGWQAWCFEQMEHSGDVSLLPGMTVGKRRKYLVRGVTTLQELASLDSATARLVGWKVDLKHLGEKARVADPSTPVTDLLARRPKQAERLVSAGICVAADLARIDTLTASFGDAGLGDLPQQIDNARARIGPSPAYRRRGIDQVLVPRADIEIDVDMESVNEGCYLWGALLNVRDAAGPESSTFVPFVSWNPDIAVGEIEAFLDFWEWFSEIQGEAARRGVALRAYCYSQGAENGQLRRLAGLCGIENDVEEFIRSEQWIDLLPIVKDQLVTGLPSMGLKTVAPLTGFTWRGDDVGGAFAMVRYADATAGADAALRAEARQWILDYNEDDVRATAALREWLDFEASLLPPIEADVPDGR